MHERFPKPKSTVDGSVCYPTQDQLEEARQELGPSADSDDVYWHAAKRATEGKGEATSDGYRRLVLGEHPDYWHDN